MQGQRRVGAGAEGQLPPHVSLPAVVSCAWTQHSARCPLCLPAEDLPGAKKKKRRVVKAGQEFTPPPAEQPGAGGKKKAGAGGSSGKKAGQQGERDSTGTACVNAPSPPQQGACMHSRGRRLYGMGLRWRGGGRDIFELTRLFSLWLPSPPPLQLPPPRWQWRCGRTRCCGASTTRSSTAGGRCSMHSMASSQRAQQQCHGFICACSAPASTHLPPSTPPLPPPLPPPQLLLLALMACNAAPRQ